MPRGRRWAAYLSKPINLVFKIDYSCLTGLRLEWSDQMKKKLPRRELVAIVDKLLTQSLSPSERQQLFQRFEDSVPYPYPSELILHLRHEFKDSTALVDFALGQ